MLCPYEQDFAPVRVGSGATVTTAAYPGSVFRGRVSYIDPRVDSQTRTTKVRVEVANPGGRLRLGMYVNMTFAGAGGQPQVVVPRAAVQSIGNQSVVFRPVAGAEGKFPSAHRPTWAGVRRLLRRARGAPGRRYRRDRGQLPAPRGGGQERFLTANERQGQ